MPGVRKISLEQSVGSVIDKSAVNIKTIDLKNELITWFLKTRKDISNNDEFRGLFNSTVADKLADLMSFYAATLSFFVATFKKEVVLSELENVNHLTDEFIQRYASAYDKSLVKGKALIRNQILKHVKEGADRYKQLWEIWVVRIGWLKVRLDHCQQTNGYKELNIEEFNHSAAALQNAMAAAGIVFNKTIGEANENPVRPERAMELLHRTVPAQTILLIEDNELIRRSLKKQFLIMSDHFLIEEAATFSEANDKLHDYDFDLVILDIQMPDMEGIKYVERIIEKFSKVKVILLGKSSNPEIMSQCYRAGAHGYLTRNFSIEDFVTSLEEVSKGQYVFPREIMIRPKIDDIGEQNTNSSTAPFLNTLTSREIEVLKLIAKGKSARQIGESLFLSSGTIETHRTNLIKKLNMKNNVQLLKYAYNAFTRFDDLIP